MNRFDMIDVSIISALASMGLVAVLGIIFVELQGRTAPVALNNLAMVTAGALAGALAVSPHLKGRANRNGQAAESGHPQMPTGS